MKSSHADTVISDEAPDEVGLHASLGEQRRGGVKGAVGSDRPIPCHVRALSLRVTDNLDDIIPVCNKELAAIETFLGGMIDALVNPQR